MLTLEEIKDSILNDLSQRITQSDSSSFFSNYHSEQNVFPLHQNVTNVVMHPQRSRCLSGYAVSIGAVEGNPMSPV